MNPRVQEAYNRLASKTDLPLLEYRNAITDELCFLTDSSISYIAAMNPKEDVLTMIGWSVGAMSECAVINKPIVYYLEDTGLWGDAVRERRPVITNDYPNLAKPTKKGYPEGHVAVQRHMNLPIFKNNKIVFVAGVGNKVEEYTLEDAALIEELLVVIMDDFWQSIFDYTVS